MSHAGGGHTAGMEGAQGELRAGLADGLGGHNTDCRAQVDHVAAAQVEAVAFGADAVLKLAGQRRADFDFGDAGGGDLAGQDRGR